MTTPKLTLSDDRTQIVDNRGNLVADVAQYSRDPSFTDRNAFLLTSAPALYAALNRLLETYAVIDEGAYCEGIEASERTPEAQELLDAQAAAYFALSLARGEKGGEVK